MISKISRIGAALLCAAAMLMLMINTFAVPVSADGCTLNIICQKQNTPLSDVEWNVYKVAEKDSKGNYVLTGDFSDYPVSLKDIKAASAMQDAANTLENYAMLDGLTVTGSGITDENGITDITVGGSGLYLISGKRYFTDAQRVTPTPMLLEITDEKAAEGSITIYPKITFENLPDEDTAEYGVKKVWKMLDQFDRYRPVNITVGIYKDAKLFKTVTLDDSNNWEYYWTGDTRSDWRVKEIDVSSDFMVVYRFNSTLYQIENTFTDTSGDDDDSSDSSSSGGSGGSIPQTGSLWWPVPVLAGAGIVLIAAGWRVSKKRK